MTMFVMGRTGSGNLHAKLCDVLKRPEEACKNGKYHVRGRAAVASLEHRRWALPRRCRGLATRLQTLRDCTRYSALATQPVPLSLQMDYETAERIEEFTQKTNVMLDSLNPRLQLPDLSLPNIMSAASKGPIATLSDWW
jgi:hypothetical protein